MIKDLPDDIYEAIINKDPDVYLGLLVVRKFAFSLTKERVDRYKRSFLSKNENNEFYFRNKLHNFFEPSPLLGDNVWYQYGKLHRDGNEPAIECFDGTKKWYKYGKLHRDGDEPSIIWGMGGKEWYKHGKRHRDNDLPALEFNGNKKWYRGGKLHREHNLPAVEWNNGTKEWYLDGIRQKNNLYQNLYSKYI